MTRQQPPEPFRIVAYIGHMTFGNFQMNHVSLAALAQSIPGSVLGVLYRNDRPYKDFITSLNPSVAATVTLPDDPGYVFPMECLIDGSLALGEKWCALGLNKPDLFLTAPMLPHDMETLTGEMPIFGVPNELVAPLGGSLIKRGVDPNRWFVCLHMREANYKYRPTTIKYRDVDPFSYMDMIRMIINDQGGQVVRLGDPSMTPLPEMDGLIDLSHFKDNYAEQIFATSRSRYFIGCDSGPISYAKAFNLPMATVNSMGTYPNGNRLLRVLPKRGFVLEDGTVLDHNEVRTLPPDNLPVSTMDNTPQQLCEIADYFYSTTGDCPGWRDNHIELAESSPDPEFSGIEIPIKWTHGDNVGRFFEEKNS